MFNSVQVRNGPTFDSCAVELKSNIGRPEETVFTGDCIDMNTTRVEKYWTNEFKVSSVVMNWEAVHERPEDVPHVPPFLLHDKQGITGMSASITIYNAGKWSLSSQMIRTTNLSYLIFK